MFKKSVLIAASLVISCAAFSSLASAKPPILVKSCVLLGTCPVINPPLPFPPKPLPLPPPPAPSGPDFHVNVNLGDGGYGGYDGITCGEGRSIVRHHGFRNVHAVDCNGEVFSYSARKHGRPLTVDVDMNGQIVDVSANY